MQLEINVTGNKVRFLVKGKLSRWYNGTEFAAIRNLVRSAEQVEAWVGQETARQFVDKFDKSEQKQPSNPHLKFSSKD
jgi:hypothetical protein